MSRKNEEKGAITLFVLLACLFFVFILTGIYTNVLYKKQSQEQNIKQIQENYAKQLEKIDEIYADYIKDIIVKLSQVPDNDTWTNQNVTLTGNAEIVYENQKITGYAFSNCENETNLNWITVDNKDTITETTEVTKNGTYYFWVKDGTNIKKVSKNVTNIDKTAPTITNISSTTNSIKIEGEDAESGINGYIITTSSTMPSKFESCTNKKQIEITKTELEQNTTYYIWIKDEAGNVSERKNIDTNIVPEGITFSANPTTWTNGNVEVTAMGVTGYTVQTSKNGVDFVTTNPQIYTENGTMYARLWDGTNGGKHGSYSITNIDKTAPTITLSGAASSTISTQATLSATVSDNESGISKIIWYYKKSSEGSYSSLTDTYTTMNGNVTGTKNATKTPSKTAGITTGLTPSTTYNIYAVLYDVAGNSKQSNIVSFTTGPAVAEHVDTGIIYTSVQNAINAVPSSGTVKLLVDHSESAQVPSGKTIHFNLDGKTLSWQGIVIDNYGTLTVAGNGKLTAIAGTAVLNAGQFNLTNGTLTSGAGWTVYNKENARFNMYGGTIQYTGQDEGTAVLNAGIANINSGAITSSRFGFVSRGTNAQATITNSTISTNSADSHPAVMADDNASITLSHCGISANKVAVKIGDGNNTLDAGKIIYLFDCYIASGQVSNVSPYQKQGIIVEAVGMGSTYYIFYYDGDATATKVEFPTWTENNGQDDKIYYNGTLQTRYGTKAWGVAIDKASHNNETGTYITHIYKNSQFSAAISYSEVN